MNAGTSAPVSKTCHDMTQLVTGAVIAAWGERVVRRSVRRLASRRAPVRPLTMTDSGHLLLAGPGSGVRCGLSAGRADWAALRAGNSARTRIRTGEPGSEIAG